MAIIGPIFGDGNSSRIIDSKEYEKDNGTKHVRFLFIPSKLVKANYDIDDMIDPNSGLVMMEYPTENVMFLHRRTDRTRCWIETDFLGGNTIATRRNAELTETLKDDARLIKTITGAKNRLHQELRKMSQQTHENVRMNVKLLQILNKAKGKDEGADEGEDVEYD